MTPGILFSKFKFHPSDEQSRIGFAFGAGMQIATSQFHTYNHELAITSRFIFLAEASTLVAALALEPQREEGCSHLQNR